MAEEPYLYSSEEVWEAVLRDDVADALGEPARNSGARRVWTKEEDEIIRTHASTPKPQWRVIASLLNERSDDAVRNRWNRLTQHQSQKNAYRSVTKGRHAWSTAEDETIWRFVRAQGKQWNKLCARMPTRSRNAIRNRYYRLECERTWRVARRAAF